MDHDLHVNYWTKNKEKDATILGSNKHYFRDLVTHIKNYSSRQRRVRVYAQAPVSESKLITVKTTGSNPGLKEDKNNKSWQYWDLSLKPLQSQSVTLSLELSVPKDFNFSW